MARPKDSGRIDLAQVFLRFQRQMLAHLDVDALFEHPSAAGAATERHWIALFNQYLPPRYRASSAFVVDSDGRRSRQIDIAVYDNVYSPLLIPHDSGLHIAAESVYAVFEVKHTLTRQLLCDAAAKAASVRRLHRTSVAVLAAGHRRPPIRPRPILAGVLALDSVWRGTLHQMLHSILSSLSPIERLDLGCILREGAFELNHQITKSRNHQIALRVSAAHESLIFLVLRLLDRLQQMGTAPAADLAAYGRSLESFSRRNRPVDPPTRRPRGRPPKA